MATDPIATDIAARLLKRAEAKARFNGEDIADAFIEFAGGPVQFAKMLWQDYTGATMGSIARQRIGGMILAMKKDGAEARSGPADDMSNDELLQVMAALAPLMSTATHADAPAGPAAPAAPQEQGAAPPVPAGADPGAAPAAG